MPAASRLVPLSPTRLSVPQTLLQVHRHGANLRDPRRIVGSSTCKSLEEVMQGKEGGGTERGSGVKILMRRKGEVQFIHADHEREREKIEREREKKKEKKRKRKAVCRHLTRLDRTRQVGRQAEGGRHQPTSSGRCCQTDMARCRRSSIH